MTDALVMYGKKPDKRTDSQKKTVSYTPKAETYVLDREGDVSLLCEETPVDIHLIIGSLHQPKPEDGVRVHYRRSGVGEAYMLVGGLTLLDGSAASPQTALALVAEGQALVDLIKQT